MRKTLIHVAVAAGVLATVPGALAAPVAHAELTTSSGQKVGMATLTEGPTGVLLQLDVKGLPPGWHGVHFHEIGDCSKTDFTSAGGHVHTMRTHVHGLLNPAANEAGDLPNLHVAADGAAQAEFFASHVSLSGAGGRAKLLDSDGAAIVIHAGPDDHMSQPIGGAGARIACGVIQ